MSAWTGCDDHALLPTDCRAVVKTAKKRKVEMTVIRHWLDLEKLLVHFVLIRDHLVFLSPASSTRNEEVEEKQVRMGRRRARRGGGILAAAQRQL